MHAPRHVDIVGHLRNRSIDNMRLAMAIAVVALHCLPWSAELHTEPWWAMMIGTAARSAVPFFFITSGIFMRLSDELTVRAVLRPIRRLAPIYLFWFVVYFLIFRVLAGQMNDFKWSELIWGGKGFHLWFLPALAVSQIGVRLLVGWAGRMPALLACSTFALLGVGLTYFPVDGFHLPKLVQGSSYGPFLVLIGALIAEKTFTPLRPARAMALLGLTYCLALVENWLIASTSNLPITYNALGIFPVALGICLLMAARTGISTNWTKLREPGRMSLALYCVHAIFVLWLTPTIGASNFVQSQTLTAVVIALALPAAAACLAIPGLRRLSS